jgi:hypothetical protein
MLQRGDVMMIGYLLAATTALVLAADSGAFAQLRPNGADEQAIDGRSPKQVNDPLPPQAMPQNTPLGAVPTPRGTPEGMGNETDFSKTPGDDDASDGIDEPGRNPIPGAPRKAP